MAPAASAEEDQAPPQPPRRQSPQPEGEAMLKEAFPSIDAAVIKAVLVASSGNIERAFNALLGMSDPDAAQEPPPPPQPPRPTVVGPDLSGNTSTSSNQLQADEQYARQLALQYHESLRQEPPSVPRTARGDPPLPSRKKATGLKPNELNEDEQHSFLDDDLPVIKENIRRTFLETQSKVNKWVSDFRRKIDGDDGDQMDGRPVQGYPPGVPQQPYGGSRSGDFRRRSADRDRERYDADPMVLGDDLQGLDLRDDEEAPPPPPRRSTRPLANPELFKPTSTTSTSSSRKVSFQAGPPDENAGTAASGPDRRPSPASKPSKWEPLATVEPSPVTDNDPFSLGDSDEEKEMKSKDLRPDDTARLQHAAAETMAEGAGGGSRTSLIANETSGPQGTRDKEAEDRLAG
ncbi:MAG: ubiquitin-binding protein cue5 [Phylliscum demangeonii]|nr:MAG: ubiquitin-binding protein cue5 [Phylliscum demangeonii]